MTERKCERCGTGLPSVAGGGVGLCPRCSTMDSTGASIPFADSRTQGAGDGSLEAEPRVDERIGRYVVEERLGRGGMGVVYRASDTALRRVVAIKVIHDPARSPERTARFRNEAATAAQLRHPGIVAVHEIGEHDGKPFIVMELVEGESLEALLAREPLPPRRVAEIARGVAVALAHAHEHGIVHRDVKPENVLVDRDGRPRLMDFGLAREMATGIDRLTASGTILGTPAYMAPEQARGTLREQGPRTDVYGLGALLYRALVGKPPHDGETLPELVRSILFDEPERPRRRNPAIHADLETVVLRCLAREPERRYASAALVAEDLGRFLDGQPIAARPVGSLERAGLWVRRNRALSAALAPLVLALLAAPFVALGLRARFRSERVAAARAARESLVARAAAEAKAARSAFDEARAGHASADAPDRLLALGLAALAAQGRLRVAAPDDPAARRGEFELACSLGEVAAAAEQWSVARAAFEEAAGLGVDEVVARAGIARVDAARAHTAEVHRASVTALIDRALSGELERRPEGREDALFDVTAYRESQTVALVASALDAVTRELRAATREVYRQAATPSADEARAGAKPIDGIDRALDARFARDPLGAYDERDERALAEAARRIEERHLRASGRVSLDEALEIHEIVARAQAKRLGTGQLALARFACEALGRLGMRDEAVPALGRYLAAEEDQHRAVPAALALCRLGGTTGALHVIDARQRLTMNGIFGSRVADALSRVKIEFEGGERDAHALLERAILKEETGDRDGALADVSRSIEIDGSVASAWHFRGMWRLGKGDVDGALADLTHAYEIEGSGPCLLDRSKAWLAKGDRRRARADLEKGAELAPRNAGIWTELGSLLESEDPAASIAALTRAIELAPKDPRMWVNRGAAQQTAGRFAAAVSDASRAIELDPGIAAAWSNRGNARKELGEWEGCLADLGRAVELEPGNPVVWRNRGCARGEHGDVEGALADGEEAVKLSHGDPIDLFNRGITRRELGDAAGAIADLERATAAEPKNASRWAQLGLAHQLKGDYADALADLEKAVKLAPREVDYRLVLGQHRMKTDPRGAVADFAKVLELDPRNQDGLKWRAMARRATGDLEGSIADFTRAVKLYPADPTAWGNRALAHHDLGEEQEAIRDATRAVELSPRFVLAWTVRGLARAGTGDLENAEADLTRTIELDPRSFEGLFARGLVRKDRKNRDGAIADLERCLELAPRRPEASEARAALEELKR